MNATIQTFGYPGTLVKEYKHWVALLRPEQVTIGSLVLAAKSEATRLGQLSDEEWGEFAKVSKEMEALLAKVFDAEKFNYLALMMKDPNVHFHFIPRYSKSVNINGKDYTDRDWPSKTELNPIELDGTEFKILKSKLKAGNT